MKSIVCYVFKKKRKPNLDSVLFLFRVPTFIQLFNFPLKSPFQVVSYSTPIMFSYGPSSRTKGPDRPKFPWDAKAAPWTNGKGDQEEYHN